MSEFYFEQDDTSAQARESLGEPLIRPDGVMVNCYKYSNFYRYGNNFFELEVSDFIDMKISSSLYDSDYVKALGRGDLNKGLLALEEAAYSTPKQLLQSGILHLPPVRTPSHFRLPFIVNPDSEPF